MDFKAQLTHQLIELDIRESKRERSPNIYRLGHYLEAAEGVTDARSFADAFNPTRGMHTVSKKLGLGLDVKSGHWVLPRKDGLSAEMVKAHNIVN